MSEIFALLTGGGSSILHNTRLRAVLITLAILAVLAVLGVPGGHHAPGHDRAARGWPGLGRLMVDRIAVKGVCGYRDAPHALSTDAAPAVAVDGTAGPPLCRHNRRWTPCSEPTTCGTDSSTPKK